jgi:hypothetical protein
MRWLWREPIGKFPPLFWLLAGALLLAALRFPTFNEPVDRDSGFYLAFGHGMHQGRHLYHDLIDHKPPGIFVAFYLAEFLTGYGPAELYFLNVALGIASLVAAYAGCALLTGNRQSGLAAAALWLAISGDLSLLANQPNAEAFMNAFTLVGLASLAAACQKPAGWAWYLFAGLCFGAASLFKQVSLATAIPVLAATILFPLGKRTRGQALGEAGLVLGTIAACWGATLALFKLMGTYPEFQQWVFDYGREYAGNMGANLFSSPPFPRHSWLLLPAILAGIAAIALRLKDRQPALLLLMLALGSHIAVALPGKTFPHYHQLWFVFASLGFGFAYEVASARPILARITPLAGFAIPLLLATIQIPNLALSPSAVSVQKYGPQFRAARVVGDFLNQTLAPGDTFFNFGDDAELYFLTRRAPLLPFADCVRLISPTYGDRDRAALLGQLQQAQPEVIVADFITEQYLLRPKTRGSARPLAPGEFPAYSRELIEFLETNYRAQIPPLGRFVVMARKGGAWEKRWADRKGRSLQEIMQGCLNAEAARD